MTIRQGDGEQLPFDDGVFESAYAQHVTMNVAGRARFFAEAWRVPKPGAFFALTAHGLGRLRAQHRGGAHPSGAGALP